jgi:hypothetical protein
MSAFIARVIALLRRRRFDREMDDEIAAHLACAADDLSARGMDPEQARRAARRGFGSVTAVREAERDSRGFPWLDDLGRDTRYALRGLRRNPASTATIVTMLALGIGATTVIFSAVDAVLLESLPIADANRVVGVYSVAAANATANPDAGDQVGPVSYPDYIDLRDSGVLEGLAAFAPISMTLDAGGWVEQVEGEIVSGNYFDLLGVRLLADVSSRTATIVSMRQPVLSSCRTAHGSNGTAEIVASSGDRSRSMRIPIP